MPGMHTTEKSTFIVVSIFNKLTDAVLANMLAKNTHTQNGLFKHPVDTEQH